MTIPLPNYDQPTDMPDDPHDRCREEIETLREQLAAMTNEVASVLMLMDGLAEQWGDEGVFRRCRDRLRKLIEPPTEPMR